MTPELKIITKNLLLLPFTVSLCEAFLMKNYSDLDLLRIRRGDGWPDADVIETLPKISKNLTDANGPTGFESWMIIKKDTLEIIGDAGFKGLDKETASADLGYGIIESERRKGFAEEAALGLITWVKTTKSVKQLTAQCLENNHASIKLLKKLRFNEVSKEANMLSWVLPL